VADPNEVLVVGAGPVGLMMAAELHRHGVPCRLVERMPEPSRHCRALGVTPRTLEAWDDLGIVDRALASGLGLLGLVSMANGDIGNAQVSGDALPDGAYGFLTLAQYDVEAILAEHLASLGGRIERGTELVGLRQADDTVTATLRHADGTTETAEPAWLIGCDGGHSAVREALQLPFEGEHYENVFLLADVELDWQLPRGYGYKLARFENDTMQGAGAAIPVPGNPRRYRLSTGAPDAMIPPELTRQGTHGISETGPSLAQVQEIVDWLFAPGVKVSDMRWSAFYRISHRIVSSYRVGRVFLAGDAAHLHPPLGGQGMNMGLQDAYNLAWKLALTVRGLAAEGLLDSYDAERRSIGRQIVERTTARMDHVLHGEVDEQEPVREDSQLFLSYRDPGADSASFAGPVAGDRAPDVLGLRRRFVHHDARLFDLLRGTHHMLLLYSNHPDSEIDRRRFQEIADALRDQHGSLIRTCAILHSDCAATPLEGLPALIDGRQEFARLYGPQRGSAYLVRPDGYLGYRAQSIDLEDLRRHLRGTFVEATR
jgi:2-polyprenyl-6-methoxyphenol hydroxylase-like FAD-dependent oxidoreductase